MCVCMYCQLENGTVLRDFNKTQSKGQLIDAFLTFTKSDLNILVCGFTNLSPHTSFTQCKTAIVSVCFESIETTSNHLTNKQINK